VHAQGPQPIRGWGLQPQLSLAASTAVPLHHKPEHNHMHDCTQLPPWGQLLQLLSDAPVETQHMATRTCGCTGLCGVQLQVKPLCTSDPWQWWKAACHPLGRARVSHQTICHPADLTKACCTVNHTALYTVSIVQTGPQSTLATSVHRDQEVLVVLALAAASHTGGTHPGAGGAVRTRAGPLGMIHAAPG
jgi:hypothetical protein